MTMKDSRLLNRTVDPNITVIGQVILEYEAKHEDAVIKDQSAIELVLLHQHRLTFILLR